MALPKEQPPPWFLIAKEYARGCPIETLSARFHVSKKEIERHLDKAIMIEKGGTVRVRTGAEIAQASARARNDLVTILQEAIDELSSSGNRRLNQLVEFEKLLGAAARLFQWPTITATRMVAHIEPTAGYGTVAQNGAPTSAVNLALIATSPEQLAELARQQDEKGARTPDQ